MLLAIAPFGFAFAGSPVVRDTCAYLPALPADFESPRDWRRPFFVSFPLPLSRRRLFASSPLLFAVRQFVGAVHPASCPIRRSRCEQACVNLCTPVRRRPASYPPRGAGQGRGEQVCGAAFRWSRPKASLCGNRGVSSQWCRFQNLRFWGRTAAAFICGRNPALVNLGHFRAVSDARPYGLCGKRNGKLFSCRGLACGDI